MYNKVKIAWKHNSIDILFKSHEISNFRLTHGPNVKFNTVCEMVVGFSGES